MMPLQGSNHHFLAAIFMLSCLITGKNVTGNLESDKQVLLNLKTHILAQNSLVQSLTSWNAEDKSPCKWLGISCDKSANHVTAIDLSDQSIGWLLFHNFSGLPQLENLNLSHNAMYRVIYPNDLGKCKNLRALNLSGNNLEGDFNLTALKKLEFVDLSNNRIQQDLRFMFPAKGCKNLVFLKLSSNNICGSLDYLFTLCRNLHSLDLSGNNISGNLSFHLDWLLELSLSGNRLGGAVPSYIFSTSCSLRALDLSNNSFVGMIPKEISNCKDLVTLNLSGNKFFGRIPPELGALLNLQSLLLGDNDLSREVPEELVGMINLFLLDLSRNGFRGDLQEIFGQFHQVKHLFLSGNSYTGGILSSGILKLSNISELNLSDNDFSGPLPLEISEISNLEVLVLANNEFTGNIPHEYGNLSRLQVLDLSFNNLSGPIPPSFGKLNSLLWLMLANNCLTGEIPAELGNCSSLLWTNFANNQLLGPIPPEFFNIGRNAPTQLAMSKFSQCSSLKRWIPTPDSPLASILASCTSENKLDLHFMCTSSRSMLKNACAYIQLKSNKLSGKLPSEISKMKHILGMFYLDDNGLYGELPSEIGMLHLLALNISRNVFFGGIPREIGMLKHLILLDLSYNNFSGEVPRSMLDLVNLSKFKISYNPYLSGRIPSTGQLRTFTRYSFLGNPLLQVPFLTEDGNGISPLVPRKAERESEEVLWDSFLFAFFSSYTFFFILSFLAFLFWGGEKISVVKYKKKVKRRRM